MNPCTFWRTSRRWLASSIFIAVLANWGALGAAPEAGGDPSTYLYEAPTGPAGALSSELLSSKTGWTLLEEEDVKHTFANDCVALNDKILAVIRRNSMQLDLYARLPEGIKLCARLRPVCEGAAELKRTRLAIRENTRNQVALELGFDSPSGRPRTLTVELNVGAPFVKTAAGSGVEKLRVEAPCQRAVLPDFFGDDILLDASTIPLARTEVPSENFLLHLVHGGQAIVMTVSESREQEIELALSESKPKQITASDISFGSKPNIWVAVLAGQGIWHEQTISPADAGQVIDLGWHMPFPALWRVDWSTVDKLTDSWEMLLQDPNGKFVMQGWFGQDEAEGQRFGKEFGARDWNKPNRSRWNPVLGSFIFPCWVDAKGDGHLQPLKERRYSERGPIYNFSGPAVIYPLDRANAAPFSTPLESLTIVDLVRMTLGVGPCQYILDLEGQKRNSRGVATCYARDIINAIYKDGTQLQNRAVIDEHLNAAVAFIRNVRERIDEYVKFGRDLTTYLEEQKRRSPAQAEFIDELLLVTKRLDQFFADRAPSIYTPEFAQRNADTFREQLLSSTDKDAATKCAALMAVFTSIGGAQDGLVASCRMIVKTLRQRAGIALAVNPAVKEIATEVRTRTQVMLRNPTPYEAPRH